MVKDLVEKFNKLFMKTKILALLILSATLLWLSVYYNEIFLWKKKSKQEKVSSWVLENKIFLEEVKVKNWNKQKIKVIKEDSKYYKIIQIEENVFYFYIKWENLVLSLDSWKIIWNFPIVLKKDIELKKIKTSKNKYLLSLKWKKYIFDLNSKIYASFNFKIPIDYLKEDENNYIIKSEKWIFLYNKKTKKIKYFHIFSDFIFYKKAYLAIILKDDKKTLNNFFIDSEDKNIIFYYDPKTKKQEIVYKTDVFLKKIFLHKWEIYFENNFWKILKLKNFLK